MEQKKRFSIHNCPEVSPRVLITISSGQRICIFYREAGSHSHRDFGMGQS
jgi:hypothetical protein